MTRDIFSTTLGCKYDSGIQNLINFDLKVRNSLVRNVTEKEQEATKEWCVISISSDKQQRIAEFELFLKDQTYYWKTTRRLVIVSKKAMLSVTFLKQLLSIVQLCVQKPEDSI